jgi:adenylate kinase family enzyme
VVPVSYLGPDEPLPQRPRRVLVAGTSGSGKTRLAADLAEILGVPHVEIDSLFHGPGWVPRPDFEAAVARFSGRERWVTEWQYRQVRPLLLARADLLVWLDLPRPLVMWQVVRRTASRRLRRERLWGVNVEPPLWTFLVDRGHIVRWAWRTHAAGAPRVAAAAASRPDLPVVRLRSRADVARWRERISADMRCAPADAHADRPDTSV